jgi:hypothetical protein
VPWDRSEDTGPFPGPQGKSDHALDEVAGQVYDEVRTWLVERLTGHNHEINAPSTH